jgi:hypothetical protein
MTEITQEQRDEIAQLKIETEQARAHNKRARFSQEYRSRILSLRQQGVTHRHFWEELKFGGGRVRAQLAFRWWSCCAPENAAHGGLTTTTGQCPLGRPPYGHHRALVAPVAVPGACAGRSDFCRAAWPPCSFGPWTQARCCIVPVTLFPVNCW